MKGLASAFEAEILITDGFNKKQDSWFKKRTLHVWAKNNKQAENKSQRLAEKCGGVVVGLRRVDTFSGYFYDYKNLKVEIKPERVETSPYESAIAMDDFIWQKRNQRRDSLGKEKNKFDKSLDNE